MGRTQSVHISARWDVVALLGRLGTAVARPLIDGGVRV